MKLKTVAPTVTAVAVLAAGAFQLSRSVAWRTAKYVADQPEREKQARAREYARQMQQAREIFAKWRLHDRSPGPRTPFYFVVSAGLFKQIAAQHLGSLKGLNIVEIAPGSSMINGALFVSAGAKRYMGGDPFENSYMLDAAPYHVAFDLAYTDPYYMIRPVNEIILKEVARSC